MEFLLFSITFIDITVINILFIFQIESQYDVVFFLSYLIKICPIFDRYIIINY